MKLPKKGGRNGKVQGEKGGSQGRGVRINGGVGMAEELNSLVSKRIMLNGVR